jgi:hypothetical protein
VKSTFPKALVGVGSFGTDLTLPRAGIPFIPVADEILMGRVAVELLTRFADGGVDIITGA